MSLSRFLALIAFLALLLVSVRAHGDHDHDHDHDHEHEEEESESEDYSKITYGSAVKLVHKSSGFRLHSHQIKWGSGSGQQSVTGFEGADDPNSLWQVKEGIVNAKERPVSVGAVVKCGDLIRLQHTSTKRWLHSHLHQSPLTHRQEISGYGEDGGVGSDTGDNWRIECLSGQQEWTRDVSVSFVHVDTGKRLFTRRQDAFDNNNCRGCPIVGQLEISAHSTVTQDVNAQWFVDDGIFFPVKHQ